MKNIVVAALIVAFAVDPCSAGTPVASPDGQSPRPALAEHESKTVDVDGRTYRVIIKNDAVMVHNKAAAYRFTMDERDRQREAVRRATGCEPTDDYDSILVGRLKTRLDCTRRN